MTKGEYQGIGFISPNKYRRLEPIPSPSHVFSSTPDIRKEVYKNSSMKKKKFHSFPKNDFDEQISDDYTGGVIEMSS